jgi:uncharacterized protein YdaU (DUF1376 family)
MSLPWMPLYVNDLMLSTAGMTNACFGAYMRLLCYAWAGALPNDYDLCARIAHGMTKADWAVIRKRLELVRDEATGEERLVHPRMESERQRADHVRSARRAAAAKTNQARWGTPIAGRIGERVADRSGERVGERSYPQPQPHTQKKTDRTQDAIDQVEQLRRKGAANG